MITVLTGENTFLVQRAQKELEAAFGGDIERYDGSELTEQLLPDLFMGATLFASERLIIIRDLSANASLWSNVEQWLERVSDETHIVLVEAKPDKRTRTYKWLQKNATVKDFKKLSDRELDNWLSTEAKRYTFDLSRPAVQALLMRIGDDQWELAQAVEKLSLVEGPITPEKIEEFIPPTPHASAFDLLDAIMQKEQQKAMSLLDEVSQTEDAYKFMGLLGSQLATLLACVHSEGRSAEVIAKEIGAHPYPVKRMLQASRRISRQDVENFIEYVAEADNVIKTSGVEPWVAVRVAIGQMLR